MSAQLRSVNAGRIVEASWAGRLGRTAIDKRPLDGRVAVGVRGLVVDEQADKPDHGGPDKALYAFAREDLDRWEQALGRSLSDGQFGENLTTSGLDVNDARIGEQWRIGSVLIEVCSVRIPCRVFAAFLRERGWVRRFTEDARPGPYLRVLETGDVAAGDTVEVVHRPDHDVTVSVVFRALTSEERLLPGLLDVPALEDDLARRAARLLSREPTKR